MYTNEIIRDKIFDLIEKKGVDDAVFADSICVSRSVVSHWRCKTSTSYIKYLKDIASYFHVTVDYLTGNEPDAETNNLISSVKERSELRDLLKAAHNASKEEVENAIKVMEALKKD